MPAKALGDLTMQSKQKVSWSVQTAENQEFPIGCVCFAVAMTIAWSSTEKKNRMPLIGIDLLGGEHHSFAHILNSLCLICKKTANQFRILVFVTPEIGSKLERFQSLHKALLPKKFCSTHEVREVIHMQDPPLFAIRRKKNSSLSIAMRFLKEGKIDALVSTGNTGALVTGAQIYLPLFKGIRRSALMAVLPTKKSLLVVLDVGANITCTTQRVVQIAQMGLAYQKSRGMSHPRLGLLNIGTEKTKGHEEIRKTYQRLHALSLSDKNFIFVGNIEGKEIFSGNIDVLVTDGFTGNVFLKTAEGISSFILDMLHENRVILSLSQPLFDRLERGLHLAKYPGAILCGVEGIIMKCRGDANPEAITNGVQNAFHLIDDQFISKMKAQLESQALGFF